MDINWSFIEFLAKERHAEYLREARENALVERFARESGKAEGEISRLCAWIRVFALARVRKSAVSEQVLR